MLDRAIGLFISLVVGLVAYRSRYATLRGSLALGLVVLVPFLVANWVWAAPLVFFALSDLLASRYQDAIKKPLGERFASDAKRDWPQIVARTIWSLLILIMDRVAGSISGSYVAFVGALAVSLADSWATELGVLSLKHPRLITTGRSVQPGSAGAVSALGLVAALVGAWLMGILGLGLVTLEAGIEKVPVVPALFWLPLATSVGGLLGSLVDSLLGATAQRISYCEECQERSEHIVHHCGRQTEQVRGWPWLSNEVVNWVGCMVGAALATGLAQWLAQTNLRW